MFFQESLPQLSSGKVDRQALKMGAVAERWAFRMFEKVSLSLDVPGS